MFLHKYCVLYSAILLLGTANGQIFDVFGTTEAAIPEFSLEMDEVFLTDLETAPVSTHHMRPGVHFINILQPPLSCESIFFQFVFGIFVKGKLIIILLIKCW